MVVHVEAYTGYIIIPSDELAPMDYTQLREVPTTKPVTHQESCTYNTTPALYY